jgi:hypothetical protein
MGENICKLFIQSGTNVQNVQGAQHTERQGAKLKEEVAFLDAAFSHY